MPLLDRNRMPALLRRAAVAKTARPARFAASVQALAQGHAQLDIYGDIGAAVASGDVLAGLRAIEAEVLEIRINSQGGNAWDGLAIYNDLRSLPMRREVMITGIAGSAASVIAMAGDIIRMADGAFFFIHNAWIDAAGDKTFHRQIADELERTDGAMTRIYAARTGIPEAEIAVLMDAETLLTAQEALDLGFCDEIVPLDGKPMARIIAAPRVKYASPRCEAVEISQLASGLWMLATELRRPDHA